MVFLDDATFVFNHVYDFLPSCSGFRYIFIYIWEHPNVKLKNLKKILKPSILLVYLVLESIIKMTRCAKTVQVPGGPVTATATRGRVRDQPQKTDYFVAYVKLIQSICISVRMTSICVFSPKL